MSFRSVVRLCAVLFFSVNSCLAGFPSPSLTSVVDVSPVSALPNSFLKNVTVVSSYTGASRAPVVLIEDVHRNVEAQRQISNLLQTLGREAGQESVRVNVEGAVGGFCYAMFHRFQNQRAVRDVADRYLDENRISGVAHAGFVATPSLGSRGLHFWGVEDGALYRENVAAYRETRRVQNELTEQLTQWRAQVEASKALYFNRTLSAFDAAAQAYHAQRLPLDVYVAALEKVGATLSSDLQSLLRCARLQRLARQNRFDLSIPEVRDSMRRWGERAQHLSTDGVLRDLEAAEQQAYELLTHSRLERRLVKQSRTLFLAERLVSLSLNIDQWRELRRSHGWLPATFSAQPFVAFYRAAEQRSFVMVENTLSSPGVGRSLSVLVTGGFHTSDIVSGLRKKHVSYVVVLPKIKKIDAHTGSDYLSVFDEPAGIGSLLTTDKFFLAEPVAGATPLLNGWHDPTIDLFSDIRTASGERLPYGMYTGPIVTRDLSAHDEYEALVDVRRRVIYEKKHPGLGGLPLIQYVSDQHGTIDKFDEFILDLIRLELFQRRRPGEREIPADFHFDPTRPLDVQLAQFGTSLEQLRGRIFIMNLGDWFHRGPSPIRVALRSMEIYEAGISDIVVGNHDILEIMALWRMHLPTRDSFNFYGYTDEYDKDPAHGTVQDVRDAVNEAYRKQGLDDFQIDLQWAKYFLEMTLAIEEAQTQEWAPFVKEINDLFDTVASRLEKESPEEIAWNKLRGSFNNKPIPCGVRMVEGMSLKWWRDRRKEFVACGSASANKAVNFIDRKILVVLEDKQKLRVEDDKRWRVLEAVNTGNNKTPEWAAKDAAVHDSWGPTIQKQINTTPEFKNKDQKEEVTAANYFANGKMLDIQHFLRRRFQLFTREISLTTSAHSFFPMNVDGEFEFEFDGTFYRGEDVWDGLRRLENIIRNNPKLTAEVARAFATIHLWYADNTTKIKSKNVAANVKKHGADGLARKNGFTRFFTGHLPFVPEFENLSWDDTLGLLHRVSRFLVGAILGFTDHGSSDKFGGYGAWILVSANGIALRGYEKSKAKVGEDPIFEAPRIGSFHHTSLLRDEFLAIWESDLDIRLEQLSAIMRVNGHAHAAASSAA